MKRKINTIQNIFDDKSVRSLAVVGDVNQAKSNTLYAIIKALQDRYDATIWASGLRVSLDGVENLNSIKELETIYNSVVIVDEFPDWYDESNAGQRRDFEKSIRKIWQSNNILIMCGLPRNFNKRIGAMMQAIIFKQCTLTDFVQRSPMDAAIKSYSSSFGGQIQKGSTMLTMPKDIALYHEVGNHHWWELDIPYIEEGDAKRFNPPILREKDHKLERRIKALTD